MSATRNHYFLISLIFLLLLSGTFVYSATPNNSTTKQTPVNSVQLPPGDFQNYLVNWDFDNFPLFVARIKNADEYNKLFKPAAIMNDNRPFYPAAQFWDKFQLIVIARVSENPTEAQKMFEVQSISENGTELTINYLYIPPTKKASFSIKYYLKLQIPKKNYTKITFIENGKTATSLPNKDNNWVNQPLAIRD